MNTRNLMRKLPSCLLGAIFAAGIASTTMVNAIDGNPPGLFELEGNTVDSAAAGTDWDALYGGATPANMITFTGITDDPAPQTIYWKGGSKDIEDVTQWWYKDGSVPDKDDITNAYAAAYSNPVDVCVDNLIDNNVVNCATPGSVIKHAQGDLIVYFGLDRYSNDGDAFAGFWFFQDAVATNGNNQFTGQHIGRRPDPDNPGQTLPGDVLVLVEYPQASGSHPEIKVYEWDPDDLDNDNVANNLDLLIAQSNAECDGSGGKLACAISNLEDLADEPAWPYTPKSGSGLPFESFFEGGINVTQLLGTTPCFAAFLAETRASRSETATLKDFVIDEFPVCGIDVTKDCTADLNQTGTGVDVTFTGTLTNTGGSSFIGYLKDDQTGSSIDDVCIDTGVAGCGDDDPVDGLVLQADGSAYFPLAAGATVRYEGSYSVTGLPDTELSDEVTALAFSDVEDVDTPALAIVSDSDTASCNFNVNAALEVVKNCTVAFLNGNTAEVTISGTVENTGDVPLSNVTLVDSDFGTLTFPTTLAVDEVQPFEVTLPVDYADLAPTTSAPDANGVVTVTLNHADTATASGDALASDGTTVLDTAEHSDSATCSDTFTRGVDVAKDCDVFLDYDDTTGRIVIRVDVSATVTNLGEETLSNIVLTDVPAVTFSGALSSLASGENFTATGSYYPSTTDAGNVATGPEASFTDEVTVTADGAFDGVEASDENTATCDLCF